MAAAAAVAAPEWALLAWELPVVAGAVLLEQDGDGADC